MYDKEETRITMYKIDGECFLLPQNDELIHVR